MSGAAQPVVVEDLDAVLIIRLFPEAAGISDGEAKALAQGIATMEAGALLESSQYEPIPGAGGGGDPTPTTPPVNVDIPHLSQSGSVLTCTMGNWQGEPTAYAYAWKMDGTGIAGNAATHTVTAAEDGKTATCVVTATNAIGSTAAPPSNAVVVAAP